MTPNVQRILLLLIPVVILVALYLHHVSVDQKLEELSSAFVMAVDHAGTSDRHEVTGFGLEELDATEPPEAQPVPFCTVEHPKARPVGLETILEEAEGSSMSEREEVRHVSRSGVRKRRRSSEPATVEAEVTKSA